MMRIDSTTHVFVLTGAGVSAESGIPTFRGLKGMWNEHAVEAVASLQGFVNDPALVWKFYSERRAAAESVKPNAGHHALARLEERLGERVFLATQNIDGLHQVAGTKRMVELHGSLWKTRCSRCARPAFDDRDVYESTRLPGCGKCQAKGEFALLRPDIVWFGERLPAASIEAVERFFEKARGHRFIFLAVGTSGAVFPAAQLVTQAREHGAEAWLVNADAAENAKAFDHVVIGRSGEVLPALLG